MYKDIANIYDLIYSFKNYKKEIEALKTFILENKETDGMDLLDVACGTGKHLKYLKSDFRCTGIDKSKEMLEIAKTNNEDVEFIHADMIDFDLGQKFDVILCLFSSIGYVKTLENLGRTLQNFSNHLKKGGVLIIEPWFTKSSYKEGTTHLLTHEDEDVKIARMNLSKRKGNLSILEMHYLIGEKGKEIIHFTEEHVLGLFKITNILELMEMVGFQARFLKEGLIEERGLFIAKK
ncbi:MAG: Methyltransferase type 11 [Promethearchaeota archaeon]|nr:MAG: Methyltransferase type 11 [Candidatus Lokiarchaeota archaeon]